jgi:transcriptional antiterminator RfaH
MYTNPKKEAFVNGQFLDRGLETFFPCFQYDRGYGRGIRIEPFFPNYVFFYADLQSKHSYDLQYMPGVRGIVRFDSLPAAVPDEMMAMMRGRLEPLERRVLKKTEWFFKPGERVLITKGPFEGLEGIFERGRSGQERVQILLTILGAATRTEIDVRHLKAVEANHQLPVPV